MKSPRILKSHESYDERYKKVIYIVRDPRDVAVSYWHHKLKFRMIGENYSIKDFSNEFISGQNALYGSWAENVNGWLIAQKNKTADILILRYEDLLASPETEVAKIIAHLNLHGKSPELIKKAVENSSFEKMGELESNQGKKWTATKNTRQDMRFVRKGQAGGWKTELPPESAEQITQTWNELMSNFGYD